MSKHEKEKELRSWLELQYFDKIDKIKGYLGIKNTTELMRFLINEKYRFIFECSDLNNIINKLVASLQNKETSDNLLKIFKIIFLNSDREKTKKTDP